MSSARNEEIPLLRDLADEELTCPKLKKLRKNQSELDELQSQYLNEMAVLETEYYKWFQHLYKQRYQIVNGAAEGTVASTGSLAGEKGVSCFWLNAMKNNNVLAEEV